MDPQRSALDRGMEALRAGQSEEALRLFEEAVETTPTDARAREMLGIALSMCGNQTRAKEELDRASALAPTDASIHYNLGLVCERAGLRQEAIAAYHTSLQADPTHKQAQERLGNLSPSAADGPAPTTEDLRAPISLAVDTDEGVDLTAPGPPLPGELPQPPPTATGLARVRCPKCQEANLASDAQCFACGAPLHTGRQGAPLLTAPSAPGAPPGPAPAEPSAYVPAAAAERSPARSFAVGPLVAGLILLLVAVGAGGWWLFLRSTPEKTLHELHAAAVAKDKAKVKGLLTAESAGLAPDMMLDMMTKDADESRPPKVRSVSYKGNTAIVTTEDMPTGGPYANAGAVMAKEGGRWKLDLVGTFAQALGDDPAKLAEARKQMQGMSGAMMEQMGLKGLLDKAIERASSKQ